MWEYKRIDVKYKNTSEIDKVLKECGEDGWEIVMYDEAQAESHNNRGGTIHLLFKRVKKESSGELLTD